MKKQKSIIEKLGITPGPWNVDKNYLCDVQCKDGEISSIWRKSANGENFNISGAFLEKNEAHKNAQLIAAAPEMLEALIAQMNLIVNLHHMENQHIEISRVNHLVEDAIEKATNKSWSEIKELL